MNCRNCYDQFYLDGLSIPDDYCKKCPLRNVDKNLQKDLYLYYSLKNSFIKDAGLQSAVIQAIYPYPTADQFLFVLEKLLVIDEMYKQHENDQRVRRGEKTDNSS